MKFNIRHKMNMSQFGRLARRFTALSLVFAMSLPTMAFAAEEGPVPAEYVEPTITIEANAVVDRWYDPKSSAMDVRDYLTGDLEVAIRVQTGKLSEEQKKLGFNSLGVALKYSPLLTPYKWTLIDGIDLSGKDLSDWTAEERTNYKKDAAQPVDLTTTQQPFEQLANMQTLKSKQITTAVGQVSGEEGKGGYLYMLAQSDRPIELVEDTVLAVVTFRYDLSKYQIVAAEAEKWLTPSVVTPPAGGAETVGEETGGETDQTEGDYDCLLQFASYTDLAGRYMGCELTYNPANGLMYYTGDANNPAIPAPEAGKALELEDPTTSKYQGAPTEGKINFRLVNHTTYNDGGLSLDDLASVLFYDWDDTLIGVLIVPRDGDARKLVNDYVRENLVHPDLRVVEPQNDPTWVSHVDSLSREYNYRGKYPSTPMVEGGEDDTMDSRRTDGLKGADYPLTNKLDYVFLKRPMEKVTEDENGDPITTNTWRQKGSDDTAEWDECFPYIYGWARLTDENWNNPGSMWTTIGRGELINYTGVEFGAYPRDPVTDDPIIESGVVSLDSTDQTFSFADFDFRKNPLPPGGVCSVKAMYEPGEDLLIENYTYRMISEPYYNKMNNPSAANGGAYNVDVLFERTNMSSFDNMLCGVARARELAVRQETTADIRWENEYLENATIAQQTGKTKTTYSNVTVRNVDEVEVRLILSGRHNKVDYYLMEAYGASFVTGGGRSQTNRAYTGSAHVVDNYNYNTADSITDRIYYRSEYVDTDGDGVVNDDRSGSYGFILLCTLNNLAQKATEYNENKIDLQTLFNYLSLNNYADINLRVDNEAIGPDIETEVKDAWLTAAEAAKKAHDSGDDRWWDAEHDCAQFTYHVIQFYVSDYVKDGKASLRDPVAAESQTISWCNLHEECAASRTGKPTSLEKMVRVALGQNLPSGVTDPKEVIALLTLAEIESMSHLRANERGTAFANVTQFAETFVRAVQEINKIRPIDPSTLLPNSDGTKSDAYWKTWDAIQGYILASSKPTDPTSLDAVTQYSKDTAWWNEGESAPSAGSLANLVAAEQKAAETGRDAWINYYRYRDAFADMKQNGVSPQAQWTRITENLVKNIDGEPFDTYEDFRAAFRAAVAAVGDYDPDDVDYWNKLQYHMVGDTRDPAVAYPSYWWHNGYSKVTSLASLLTAAQEFLKGNTAVWDMFTLDDLYDPDLTELHFRNGFNGTTDIYTDIDDFKDAVLEFIQADGAIIATGNSTATQRNNSWNQLQYYLIHKDDPGGVDLTRRETNLAIQAESPYYWWKDGKDGAVYPLTPGVGDFNIQELSEAIYRAAINGNPKALDELTVVAATFFRLVPSYAGTEKDWDEMTKYDAATLDQLKNSLEALAKAAGETDCKSLTWRQIQHYLLGGGYLTATDPNLPTDTATDKDNATTGVKNYWWKLGSANPNLATEPIATDLDTFLGIIDEVVAGTYADDFYTAIELYIGYTEGSGSRMNLYGGWTFFPQPVEFEYGSVANLQMKLDNIVMQLSADGVSAADALDWFVLQYYAFEDNDYWGGPLVSKEDAKNFYLDLLVNTGLENWAPSYVDVAAAGIMMLPADTMFLTPAQQIERLTRQIMSLTEAIREVPELAAEYAQEIARLMAALEELKALLEGAGEPAEPACTCGSEDDVHTEDCPLYVAPEVPEESTCTCGSEDDVHAEDCPLYVASEIPEKPTCTCGSEDDTHAEDCPLYVVPEVPVDPEESVDPELPIEPTEPTEPEEPVDPETPTDPPDSTTPDGELTEPEVPGEETPTEPAEPTEPVEPEKPPEMTEEPEETEKPETTETDVSIPELSAKVSTKIIKPFSRRLTALTNLLFDSGGWKMNGITTQRNISPPGQLMARLPWFWTNHMEGRVRT